MMIISEKYYKTDTIVNQWGMTVSCRIGCTWKTEKVVYRVRPLTL